MNISLNRLRAIAPFPQTDEELIERLTLLGLEVDAVEKYETVKGSLEGVVTGRVEKVIPHPDADRLRICTVRVSETGEPLQIVCGAPNVAEGQKVPVALPGTTLYPVDASEPLTLKKSKIRGVESFGMICAEDELGTGKSHDGILVLPENTPVGRPVAEVLELYSDTIVVIGLTPNRTDAMCHYGAARDLAAYFSVPISLPEIKISGKNESPSPITVEVQDTERCPVYTGIYIKGVQVGESPAWLKNALLAVGQRPINNIVDVTNYILTEYGQPLHAFDTDEIRGGKIIVKMAAEGETFITLDEKKHALNSGDLMICDAERSLCIAGVMGGLNSGVTEKTTSVFLESAYFLPSSVRKTSSGLGIFSETAYRFARGTDPNGTEFAALKAAELIAEICGGTVEVSTVKSLKSKSFDRAEVAFSYSRCNKLMGTALSSAEMNRILTALEIEILPDGTDSDRVRLKIPTYRTDVTRFQDVAEEIIRQYGLNNVPAKSFFSVRPDLTDRSVVIREKILNDLAAAGLYEIRTNSLGPVGRTTERSVSMLNPLSEETAVMRESMLASGLEVISYNLNRKQEDLRLYEWGKIYYREGKDFKEESRLAIYTSGSASSAHWSGRTSETDYFDLKGLLSYLFSKTGVSASFQLSEEDSELFFGQTIYFGKKRVGKLGKVNGSKLKEFDIKASVFYAELDGELLIKEAESRKVTFAELSRFPSVRRDFSMLTDGGITYGEIEKAIREGGKNLIAGIDIFDVYQPKDSSQVSYAVAVTLSDPKETLQESVIKKTIEKIMERLEKTGKITLRTG